MYVQVEGRAVVQGADSYDRLGADLDRCVRIASDGCAEYQPAALLDVGRQVSATAGEADSQRRSSSKDHRGTSFQASKHSVLNEPAN